MQQKRIEWLASLRGILVLLVFMSHLSLFINISKDLAFVIGRIGVAGFFITSGYLAVTSIAKRNAKQYLFNRFLRIYPIFWLLLLCVFFLTKGEFSIIDLAKNMTLLSKTMIGASWMLPILVFMFVCLTFIHKFNLNVDIAFYTLLVFSILLGLGRYITGIKLPTAFFLLSALGVLSYKWKSSECKFLSVRNQFIVYEVVLLISTALSYSSQMPWYFLAYNAGGGMCLLFKYNNIKISALEFFGKIGFTFFLGAGIPMMTISLLGFNIESLNDIEESLLKFLLIIPFSWLITHYLEQPMLRWGKKIEKKL